MNRNKNLQISETFLVASVLALAGGFMDTYSYLCRGGVFANAETGNVVLFAINLGGLHWMKAIHFLVPILAFATGVVISFPNTKSKFASINCPFFTSSIPACFAKIFCVIVIPIGVSPLFLSIYYLFTCIFSINIFSRL